MDACSHCHAVGQFGGDVGAVEDVGGVSFSLLAARGFAGGFELFEAVGVEGRGAVEVEEGEPCVVERGEGGTEVGGVGVGDHVVDGEGVEVAVGGVGGRGEERVGVVVDGGDGGDLGG